MAQSTPPKNRDTAACSSGSITTASRRHHDRGRHVQRAGFMPPSSSIKMVMYDRSLRSLPQLESREKPHPRSVASRSPLHGRFSFSWNLTLHRGSGYLEPKMLLSECYEFALFMKRARPAARAQDFICGGAALLFPGSFCFERPRHGWIESWWAFSLCVCFSTSSLQAAPTPTIHCRSCWSPPPQSSPTDTPPSSSRLACKHHSHHPAAQHGFRIRARAP